MGTTVLSNSSVARLGRATALGPGAPTFPLASSQHLATNGEVWATRRDEKRDVSLQP